MARHYPEEGHMDGCDAARRAWDWIDALALDLCRTVEAARLNITSEPRDPSVERIITDLQAVILWRDTEVYAAAFLLRDQMNFTRLIRWRAEDQT